MFNRNDGLFLSGFNVVGIAHRAHRRLGAVSESEFNSNVTLKRCYDVTTGIAFKKGIVKFFNAEKGFGFIKQDGESDLFFHATNFRQIEADHKNFEIRWKDCETEEKKFQVEVRDQPRPYYDYWDYAMFGLERPEPVATVPAIPSMKTVFKLVKKLPRVPQVGDAVLYVVGNNRGKTIAEIWMFDSDLPSIRYSIENAHRLYQDQIANLPIYKVVQTITTYGPSVANNAKKCFERTVNKADKRLFEGNNVEELLQVTSMYTQEQYGDNIDYTCYRSIGNGGWKECPFPTM